MAKANDIFAEETFGEIEKLANTLSQIKGVKQAISLPGIRKSIDITGNWTLDEFRNKIKPVDLLTKNIISRDGRTTAISLILDDIRDKDDIIHSVKEILDRQKHFLSLYQIGMPIVSKALADFTEQDFLRLPPVTFFLVVLILFLFFRNLRGVLIPAGSVAIALIWTFGLMAVTRTPLSLMTMIVPIFLIAVGTAYCMYIFPEYLSAINTAESPREASLQCFLKLGFSHFSCRDDNHYRSGLPAHQQNYRHQGICLFFLRRHPVHAHHPAHFSPGGHVPDAFPEKSKHGHAGTERVEFLIGFYPPLLRSTFIIKKSLLIFFFP